MSEAVRALGLGGLMVGLTYGWLSVRAARVPVSSPERLVAEFRVMQIGSLILVLVAGAYLGFAAAAPERTGVGLDVLLALAFLVVAAVVLTQDPREGLAILALAFAVHALVDILHRPGLLPDDVAPRWYAAGCASLNVYLGALSYLPILKR